MKYQFTTEGSKSQTLYWDVRLANSESGEVCWEQTVSTPLNKDELIKFINERLKEGFLCSVSEGCKVFSTNGIIGLDSLARILSNIKPIKHRIALGGKVYEVDADKLEKFLKSLE